MCGRPDSHAGVPPLPWRCRALHEVYQRSTALTPIVLYAKDIDPSSSIETYTRKQGYTVHSLVVTQEKAEKGAVKDLLRWGCGRGHWVYVTTAEDGWEHVVRLLAVTLQSQNGWMVHKKFRLWIRVPCDYYTKIPEVLLCDCVPLDLVPQQKQQKEAEEKNGARRGFGE